MAFLRYLVRPRAIDLVIMSSATPTMYSKQKVSPVQDTTGIQTFLLQPAGHCQQLQSRLTGVVVDIFEGVRARAEWPSVAQSWRCTFPFNCPRAFDVFDQWSLYKLWIDCHAAFTIFRCDSKLTSCVRTDCGWQPDFHVGAGNEWVREAGQKERNIL